MLKMISGLVARVFGGRKARHGRRDHKSVIRELEGRLRLAEATATRVKDLAAGKDIMDSQRQVEVILDPNAERVMQAVHVVDVDTGQEFGYVRKATIVLDAETGETSIEVVWGELDCDHTTGEIWTTTELCDLVGFKLLDDGKDDECDDCRDGLLHDCNKGDLDIGFDKDDDEYEDNDDWDEDCVASYDRPEAATARSRFRRTGTARRNPTGASFGRVPRHGCEK